MKKKSRNDKRYIKKIIRKIIKKEIQTIENNLDQRDIKKNKAIQQLLDDTFQSWFLIFYLQ